jgi:putative RecB family exonuclease
MTTTDLGMPGHFSYSALSGYVECGKRYQLEKIKRVPQIPSWWFVGGGAFHTVSEEYDRDPANFDEDNIDGIFQAAMDVEFNERKAKYPDVTKWRAAGRRSKANPDGEDYIRWLDLGPKFVREYISWRKLTEWKLWEVGGQLAIELPLDFEVGGWRVRGAIDRVFWGPNGKDLIVVDLKTGSRMPESDTQLGFYAAGMEVQYGVRPKDGLYYNPRLAKPSRPYELGDYTPQYIGEMGQQLKKGISGGVFLPHKTRLCDFCPVNHGCATYGGKDAHLYDDLHPNYRGDNNE